MPKRTSRPSYRNRLSVATLTTVTLLCVVLAGAFVAFVVSRNRLSALADEQRKVEQQIALFHQEIQALEKRIDTSLTRDKVHERLTAGNTYLKPIEPDTIITLPRLSAPPVETETGSAAPTVAQTTLK